MLLYNYSIMSFAEVVKELLEGQYPRTEETKIIIMSSIILRILPPATSPLFLRYNNLETLVITKCDLRNLENFPKLASLKQLDLSNNSLQGSFNYLMPLSNLKYLDLANNLITDCRKLQPLQVIEGLEVFMIGNPFLEGDAWRNKVRSYGLKVAKEARIWETQRVKQEQKKEEKKQEKQKQKQKEQMILSVVSKEVEDCPRRSLFLQMRARRQRALQHQTLSRRVRMPQVQSDSLSMLQILGEGGDIGQMIQNYGQESEDLQDDSDNQDSENEKKDEGEQDEQQQELLYNEGFVPLGFDADDLQEDQPSEEDSDD